MRNLLILLLILASFSVLIGVFAKIRHWPGADVLLGAGLVTELFCAVLLVLHFWRSRKQA
jgi:hypothetical protein